MSDELRQELEQSFQEAIDRAIDSLARYKFERFGYWASQAVLLGQFINTPAGTQLRPFVDLARRIRQANQGQLGLEP